MVGSVPAQGDIVKLNLSPKMGHEQQGYRPYICLSHSNVAKYANIAIFAPISNTERSYPFYIELTDNLLTTGKVMLDQLVTIDYNARNISFIESVPEELVNELLQKARVIFERG